MMFHSIELRTYCHATEDRDRVTKALATLYPEGSPTLTSFEGHHRNPIVLMTCRIEGSKPITDFWRRCKETNVVHEILQDLSGRIDDEGVLHFRVDKQMAYEGHIELARHEDVIAVRAKVAAFPAKKSAILRAARESLARV